MFSCLVVQLEDNITGGDLVVAETADVHLQIISNAGRGTANLTYRFPNSKDVIACVPSTLCVRGVSTQQIKVTKCRLEVQREGYPIQSTSLQLSKVDSEYSVNAKGLPRYSSIKKALRRSVAPDDLILHLGHFELNTHVTIQFEFLIQLKLASALSSTSSLCHIENNIPAKRVSYKLKLASQLQIVNISPVIPSHLSDFSWFYVDRSKHVIQMSYKSDNLHGVETGTAFCIELAENHTHSACCSCLRHPFGGELGKMTGKEYDGVMMLSSRVTRDQLQTDDSDPSEFVFLVDCSASMNPFIDAVIATLITAIKSLPKGSFLNIVSFGSNYRQLFHESKEYSKNSVKSAVDFANQLKANLGGTELLPPLRWIYKKARKTSMPCQIFIITDIDQEVKDNACMLSNIRKNKHYARCHTFGIGSNICESLVTSIAEASGGRGVILQEGDRLQTKVMEVLKESLEPFMMKTEIRWQPPHGYTVVDSTPKSFGTVYSQQTNLAFAFLKRTPLECNRKNGYPKSMFCPATLVGQLRGQDIEIPIREATMPSLTSLQTSEMGSILEQVGRWCKLDELEISRLASISRRNSTEEEEAAECDEPKSKRPRLNGEMTSNQNSLVSTSRIKDDIIELSLDSEISCPFTFLKGTFTNGRGVVQVLPYRQTPLPSLGKNRNGVILHQRFNEARKRNRRRYNGTSNEQQQISMAAVARSTISAVGSSFMSLVNIFHPDNGSVIEGGNTLEDELEIQSRKGTQLYWDENRKEIKYPAMYYRTNNRPKHNTKSGSKETDLGSFQQDTEQLLPSSSSDSSLSSAKRFVLDTSSSSDDEEDTVTISDSESDCSVDVDWESLPKTREYIPMIQMQLFSGAWPMVYGFSYAVRVPLNEIYKLPLVNQQSEKLTVNNKAGSQRKNCLQDIEDESNAHFWTTALAVVCFQECFPEFEREWELIVRKGEFWLEKNLSQCGQSMDRVYAIAKELLFRKS